MPVNELDVKKQIRRLRVVFNTSKPEPELIEGWLWVLKDKVNNGELMTAVSEYAQSGARYFPNPGQILDLVRSKRSPVEYQDHDGGNDAADALECPTCKRKLRVLAPEEQVWTVWDEDERKFKNILPPAANPRLGILHDYKAHRDAKADIVGSYRK